MCGRTVAHYAILLKDRKALKLLLANGADPNIADNDGKTLLDLANTHADGEMHSLLQDAGAESSQPAKIIQPEDTSKEEVIEHVAKDLFEAATNNDRAGAKRLLADDAEARAKNAEGKVPFDIAVEAQHHALAAILLKAAAGINGRDEKGWTPLHWAIIADDWELVDDFLREGADIFVDHRQNVIEMAELMQSKARFIDAVVAIQGSVVAGREQLIPAVERGHTKTVARLLEHVGANVNAKDKKGWTALIHAVSFGRAEIAELLLKHGANIEAQDKYGWTALIHAASSVQPERTAMVNPLLMHGANIKVEDNASKTAMMHAIKRGKPEVAELLRTHGATY